MDIKSPYVEIRSTFMSYPVHYPTRQNQVGRCPKDEIWVVVAVDTHYIPAKGIAFVTRRRDRACMFPVLARHFRRNTSVHTDEWGAYHSMPRHLSCVVHHSTVNHTRNFVDPQTGAHIQVIFWTFLRTQFSKM